MQRTIINPINTGTVSKANFWEMGWSTYGLFQVHRYNLERNNNIPLHAFFFSLRIVQHLLVIQVSNPLSWLVKVILQWLDQPFSGLRNQGVNVVRTVWTSIGLTTDKKVNVVRTAWKALGLNTDKKKRNFLLACSLFVCCLSGWICLSFFGLQRCYH